jgi:AcrR family transcriptional regulator
MRDVTTGRQTRRRGAELEDALLTAAWDELLESGYESLTLESVAARARTSRPVIARRWTDRRDLVIAAVRHWAEHNRLPVPDTGSLRGDLLAYLEEKSVQRAELIAVFGVRLAAFVAENQDAARQLGELITQSQGLDDIWHRAASRGEVNLNALTPRLRSLPFDLVGAELARTHQALARAAIEEILDTIVLPLVTSRSSRSRAKRPVTGTVA